MDQRRLDVPRGYPGFEPKLPTAHSISENLFQVKKKDSGNRKDLSTLFMTMGQFIDHDLIETPSQACKAR